MDINDIFTIKPISSKDLKHPKHYRNWTKEFSEPDNPDKLYRVGHIIRGSDDDKWVSFQIQEFHILKRTPKGCYINYLGKRKWIGYKTRVKVAHQTKAEALRAYWYRKQKQVKIMESILSGVHMGIEDSVKLMKELNIYIDE